MSNAAFNYRKSIPINYGNITKINPFNQKKNNIIYNNISGRRKYYIPTSTREFGKEINLSTNLTTFNNQDAFNGRRSYHQPMGSKQKKELQNIKIKNYEQLALRKKKKEGLNSYDCRNIYSLTKTYGYDTVKIYNSTFDAKNVDYTVKDIYIFSIEC